MKLEKVVSRPKKGLWVFLFILGLAVVGTMATSYNFEVVRQFKTDVPWLKIVLGGIGFIIILSSLVLFFTRLLREMKVSQIQADFLDRISHELRTPLATLTLVSDLLKEPKLSSEEIDRLWSAHHLELERLKGDVELLLRSSRLRDTRLQANLKPIVLEDWIEAHWGSFEVLLGKDAEFKRVGNPIPGSAELDSTLFELILRNLLDNARKFSLHHPVVQLKREQWESGVFFKTRRWRISIIDQGLGFAPQNQKWLFKRFSRLPFFRSDLKSVAIPGTGLGLYLAATASKAMGLTLTGQSLGEGRGAEFILEGKLLS